MKLNQIIFPLVLALAATLATTGCKKGPVKTTIIPGHPPIVGNGDGSGTLPSVPPLDDPNRQANYKDGPITTANRDEFEGMIKDPAALAAYTVHFAFDSSVVRKSEQASIASVAQALSSSPNDKLLIEGNCDERGTEEYNRALGERRALALREALAKDGVDPSRIRTISYGKDKPADPGHNEAAWAKNRRDDFILLHPKPGV
jgi:peptidoglycan-associated lipoprotein